MAVARDTTAPTFVAHHQRTPRACPTCRSSLLIREEPDGLVPGEIICIACSRRVCWLESAGVVQARQELQRMKLAPKSPLPQRKERWRQSGCSDRCHREQITVSGAAAPEWRVYHDLPGHEQYLLKLMAESRPLGQQHGTITTGPLAVDLDAQTVTVAGTRVYPSPGEWSLLAHLAGNLGQLCSIADLIRATWPDGHYRRKRNPDDQPGDPLHALRITVMRLRARLGHQAASLIETESGRGYRLRVQLKGHR